MTVIAGSAGTKKAGKEFSVAAWATVKLYLIVEDEPPASSPRKSRRSRESRGFYLT
ncbi:MAG: hypothetical protein HC821_05940 [Lewinella sp.]|nr:hypothetical protein [Lewinella sp.]